MYLLLSTMELLGSVSNWFQIKLNKLCHIMCTFLCKLLIIFFQHKLSLYMRLLIPWTCSLHVTPPPQGERAIHVCNGSVRHLILYLIFRYCKLKLWYFICMSTLYLWTLLNSIPKWIPNCTLLSSFHTLFHKLIVDGVLYKCATSSITTLSLVEEQGTMGKLHCKVHISVGKNYNRALSAKFQCHTL